MNEDLAPIPLPARLGRRDGRVPCSQWKRPALDLPHGLQRTRVLPWLNGWPRPASLLAAIASRLVVGALALYARAATGPAWSRWALGALSVVMLANAASHIVLSAMTASLMPGVADRRANDRAGDAWRPVVIKRRS